MLQKRTDSIAIDYRSVFQNVPIGLAIGADRVLIDCNRAFLDIFGGTAKDFIGRSFAQLYPTPELFESAGERFGPVLRQRSTFSDNRVMRRLNGELCWINVCGFSYAPETPFKRTIWTFSELSTREEVAKADRTALTPRERDIASLLIEGKSGKEVALTLRISPRTVDIYKTRLLRKYGVTNTQDLVRMLLAD